MAKYTIYIRVKILVWLAWMSALVVGGFFLVMWFGAVNGEEFNPHTLVRRSFRYYQIPGVRVQVSPIIRNTFSVGFEKHLTAQNFVKTSQKSVWHLVWAKGTRPQRVRGDASILIDYLGHGDSPWKKWSTDRPKLAKLFWPVIMDLARRNHYLIIPDLMDSALDNEDEATSDFQHAVHRSLVEQYLHAAKIEQHENGSQPATEMLEFAVQYASGNEELEALVSGYEDGAN